MAQSYRTQLSAAIGRILPVADFRALDRQGRDLWGWYPLSFVWLFQIFSRGATLGERFREVRVWLRRLAPSVALADTYQGFVKALRRRADVLSVWLNTAFQQRLQHWLRDDDLIGGWRPLAVDGTRFDCPRSRSCQQRFPLAGRAKSPPQLALTTLWHLSAHCFWDGRVGPATTSERTMLREMLDHLPPQALLVGDAGFAGYSFCSELIGRDVAFLLRVGGNIGLLRQLGVDRRERTDTVYLWPEKQRAHPPLTLRLIVVGSAAHRVYLVTNVLSSTALPRSLAADFYRRRWGVETAYRAVKQTLERRKLRSEAHDLALWELVGIFLGAWALSLTNLFARGHRRLRRTWSPAQTARLVRAALAGVAAPRLSLRRALANAVLDPIARRRKKTRQDWPHKKHDPLCGAPKLILASWTLSLRAQRLAAIPA